MIKQIIGYVALCAVLFGCQKQKPEVYIKTVYIYRDTCDSEFIKKIGFLESGNTDSISGDSGMGIGRFGIYDICVTGTGFKTLLGFTHMDMYNPEKSEAVFWGMMGIFCHQYYQKHGKYPSFEELARMWAGGPDGYKKDATLKYLAKFRKQ